VNTKNKRKLAVLGDIMNTLDYKLGHYVRWKDVPVENRKEVMNTSMFDKT
jgi:hypothetical protein